MLPLISISLYLLSNAARAVGTQSCRNIPGSPDFPTEVQWQAFNVSLSGRLVRAIPSGEYCRQVACTDAEWTSSTWRNMVPGAMNQVNWEQDYEANPPSLCGRTSPPTCGQGNVPPYAILAESAADIQAGVNFARKHNLRLSVKASGHDYLGRSTAKDALLIHTHKLQSVAFTENFRVGGHNKGSAVTVGSGVGLNTLYTAAQNVGKIFVGGSAATVVAAGGYVQGAGHSALSPLMGLAADNALEFNIVTANGLLRRANELENPNLFWALRGGGAGSWGVIVNATFKTFPTFNATHSTVAFLANNSTVLGAIAQTYAEHIFDWDTLNVGQYFYALSSGANSSYVVAIDSYFPRATAAQASAAMAPFFADISLAGGSLLSNTTVTTTVNTILTMRDDQVADYLTMGSRLIPATTYKSAPHKIGDAYKRLADAGTIGILSHLVAGGKVAENAVVNNAVNPGWRVAKTHLIGVGLFNENSTLDQVHAAQNNFQNIQAPIFKTIEGSTPAAYSNEADAFEKNWQAVFYGHNYRRLSLIKSEYDPTDLFIVKTGVGSERWDAYGLCRV